MAITIWTLWTAGNNFLHERINQGIGNLISIIRSFCKELNSLTVLPRRSVRMTPAFWSPPPDDVLKINVDANINLAQYRACLGSVIRDSHGEIMGSCCKLTWPISSVFLAEAWAIVHGLQFASDLGFHRIIVESDSRGIIKRINNKEDDSSEVSALIWDAKEIAKKFSICAFQNVGRDGNGAAHSMSQFGIRNGEVRFWVEDAPDSVLLAAEEDRRRLDPHRRCSLVFVLIRDSLFPYFLATHRCSKGYRSEMGVVVLVFVFFLFFCHLPFLFCQWF